ncbi:MAG: hypothetical protein WAJ93_06825 [Candidatus Nitrosopolaris sp.]
MYRRLHVGLNTIHTRPLTICRDAHRSDAKHDDACNASLSGKTSEDMAGRVGVSARTYERVKFILKEGTEEQI